MRHPIIVSLCVAGAVALSACDKGIDSAEMDRKFQGVNVVDESDLNEVMLTVGDPNEAVAYFQRTLKENSDRIEIRRDGQLVFADATRMEGAISEQLDLPAVAAGHRAMASLKRNDKIDATRSIGRALDIVNELLDTLDHDPAPEISTALEALYVYIGDRLLLASSRQDQEALQEVITLMSELRQGWSEALMELRRSDAA